MGLFGLGWGEIGVIAVIGLFFFGPEKLAPLAKEFGALDTPTAAMRSPCDCVPALSGKSASGLKEVTDSFKEGMVEAETGVSKDGGAGAMKSAADTQVAQTSEVKDSTSV